MKIGEPNLPQTSDVIALKSRLTDFLRGIANQLNGISEGTMAVRHNAAIAAPVAGAYRQGDFVPNSAPSEMGSAGSKYIVTGWTCVTSGTPGTWVQTRSLTGN